MTPEERRVASRGWTAAWRAKNRDRVREVARKRRAAIRDELNAANRARRVWTGLAHRASHFAYGSNKRAETLGLPGRLTGPAVKTIAGPCVYCGAEARGWDHVIPMALGGPNTIENLVPACLPCNQCKNRYPGRGSAVEQIA